MSADLTKASELFRHFALNSNSNEAFNALSIVIRKLEAENVDLHQLHLTIGKSGRSNSDTELADLRLKVIQLQAERNDLRHTKFANEARIKSLEKHTSSLASHLTDLEAQLEAAQAKKTQTPRSTTEWVRQVSYTPYDAREEKRRIDDAIDEGIVTPVEGAKFKSHVSRRIDRECDLEIAEVETIWQRGTKTLNARVYTSLDVEYAFYSDIEDPEEVSFTENPDDLDAPKSVRDAARRHRRQFDRKY